MMMSYDLWPAEVRREFDQVVAKLPPRATAAQRRQAILLISPKSRDWLLNAAIDEALRATVDKRIAAAKSEEEAGEILMAMPLPLPSATRDMLRRNRAKPKGQQP